MAHPEIRRQTAPAARETHEPTRGPGHPAGTGVRVDPGATSALWPLEVWIAGHLENPNNGAQGALGRRGYKGRRWSRRGVARKFWRTAAQLALVRALWRRSVDPEVPKRVTFFAQVFNLFDDDGLAAACKGARDGVKAAGVIHDDSPRSGHEFVYRQAIDRAQRGLRIRVELR